MEPRSLKFIAEACAADVRSGSLDTVVSRVCTDSRQLQRGDLFFALKGERFDGHDYVVDVARQGAAAVVVEPDKAPLLECLPPQVGFFAVANCRAALGALATRYRADFRLAMIAVGGSNGKTTTKELLASVLRQRFNTLWSQASFNNDIGVPLTLLQLDRSHQAAVVEVGTNHPGELPPLVRMVQPQYGVLTNIGHEHLEFFHDLAGVAQEEGWLAELLPAFGRLFLNGDEEWLPAIVKRTQASVVTAGLGARNDWRAGNVWVGEEGVKFEVNAPRPEYSGAYQIRLLGRHQVSNALLALAVGTELGVPPELVRRGLAECAPLKLRLQIKHCGGVGVLNDAYNANADSMRAALETLRDLPCNGRRVAVLGDMAELGSSTAQAHREVGQRAAELGIDRLLAVGTWAQETAEAARRAGMNEVFAWADVPVAVGAIVELVKPGDMVLIKASRAAGLDRIAEAVCRGASN